MDRSSTQQMAKIINVLIRKKGKKWSRTIFWRATFTRGQDIEIFDSFEEAYRSARECDKVKVKIDWHPDWMQKAIDKVENQIKKKK